MKMFKMEIRRRIPNMADEELESLAEEHQKELMEDMEDVDENEDGLINQKEYENMHSEGMGKELSEAADQDNNAPDPDDLSRDPKAKAGKVGQAGVLAAQKDDDAGGAESDDEDDKEIAAEEAE